MTRIALVALLLAACHRSPGQGAPCDAVGAHFITVAQSELDTHPELDTELAGGVRDLLPPIRDSMVRECKDNKWSADARDCFAGAADGRAMKACYARLDPAQRAALDRSAAGHGDDDAN